MAKIVALPIGLEAAEIDDLAGVIARVIVIVRAASARSADIHYVRRIHLGIVWIVDGVCAGWRGSLCGRGVAVQVGWRGGVAAEEEYVLRLRGDCQQGEEAYRFHTHTYYLDGGSVGGLQSGLHCHKWALMLSWFALASSIGL